MNNTEAIPALDYALRASETGVEMQAVPACAATTLPHPQESVERMSDADLETALESFVILTELEADDAREECLEFRRQWVALEDEGTTILNFMLDIVKEAATVKL